MLSEQEVAAYIAGMIDGEGHIGCHKTARGHWSRSIGFCNTDKALVDFMANALKQLGFKPRITTDDPQRPGWSPRWTLYIGGGRDAFTRFANLIPIQAPAKKAALRKVLETYMAQDRLRDEAKSAASVPCEICEAPVLVSPAFRRRGGGRFCGVTCRGLSQRTRVIKHCCQCGGEFEATPSRVARFCSRRCMGDYRAIHDSERLAGMAKRAASARWHRR